MLYMVPFYMEAWELAASRDYNEVTIAEGKYFYLLGQDKEVQGGAMEQRQEGETVAS